MVLRAKMERKNNIAAFHRYPIRYSSFHMGLVLSCDCNVTCNTLISDTIPIHRNEVGITGKGASLSGNPLAQDDQRHNCTVMFIN
jgi:hypothetical protein